MIEHFELPHNFSMHMQEASDTYQLTGKILAARANLAESAVIDEIRKIADEQGYTEVYLLDAQQITKMFVDYERYRQIGTPEEFRDAMETLKKLEKWMDDMK